MNGRRQLIVGLGLGLLVIPVVRFVVTDSVSPAIAQEEVRGRVIANPDQPVPDSQQEYLNLIQQKVKLLTPDELNGEIKKLRLELVELESAKKMREIVRQLEELIEQHPQSRAAERARLMIQDRAPDYSRSGGRYAPVDSDSDLIETVRPKRTTVPVPDDNNPFESPNKPRNPDQKDSRNRS